MFGIICAIISGISMSLQGVFNTRLGEKIGTWETNVIVQASGLILTLLISFFLRKGSYNEIKSVNKLYLLGGALGVVIPNVASDIPYDGLITVSFIPKGFIALIKSLHTFAETGSAPLRIILNEDKSRLLFF